MRIILVCQQREEPLPEKEEGPLSQIPHSREESTVIFGPSERNSERRGIPVDGM